MATKKTPAKKTATKKAAKKVVAKKATAKKAVAKKGATKKTAPKQVGAKSVKRLHRGIRLSPAQRAKYVKQFYAEGGKKLEAFCVKHGINPSLFRNWKKAYDAEHAGQSKLGVTKKAAARKKASSKSARANLSKTGALEQMKRIVTMAFVKAVRLGHYDMAKQALSEDIGIDPDIHVAEATSHGETLYVPVIHFAVRNGDQEMVKLLLDHGVDVGSFDNAGTAPIHFASKIRDAEMIRLLVSRGANVNDMLHLPENMGERLREHWFVGGSKPLHHALLRDQETEQDAESIRTLIELGADVNAVTARGRTPLHFVKHVETARVLLASGANLFSRDVRGQTVAHVAADLNRAELLAFFLEQGLSMEDKDYSGKSVIDIARDSEELVEVVAKYDQAKLQESLPQAKKPGGGKKPIRL